MHFHSNEKKTFFEFFCYSAPERHISASPQITCGMLSYSTEGVPINRQIFFYFFTVSIRAFFSHKRSQKLEINLFQVMLFPYIVTNVIGYLEKKVIRQHLNQYHHGRAIFNISCRSRFQSVMIPCCIFHNGNFVFIQHNFSIGIRWNDLI